jgi:hypothetical protein
MAAASSTIRRRRAHKADGDGQILTSTIAYTGADGVMQPATMTIGGVPVPSAAPGTSSWRD